MAFYYGVPIIQNDKNNTFEEVTEKIMQLIKRPAVFRMISDVGLQNLTYEKIEEYDVENRIILQL